MARKGDIDSKSIASRVPMKVYIRLQTMAYESNKTMSAFICDVLSDENFSQGGETKIQYRDKLVPKIEYIDRIVEKKVEVPINVRVPIDNPILIKENESLKREIEELKLEIVKLTPKKYTTKATKNKEECHPDWEWIEECGYYIPLRKFNRNSIK